MLITYMRIEQDFDHIVSRFTRGKGGGAKPAHIADVESWSEALVLHCGVMLFGILGQAGRRG